MGQKVKDKYYPSRRHSRRVVCMKRRNIKIETTQDSVNNDTVGTSQQIFDINSVGSVADKTESEASTSVTLKCLESEQVCVDTGKCCNNVKLCEHDNGFVIESGRLDTSCAQESIRAGRRIDKLGEDDCDVVRSCRLDTNSIQESTRAGRSVKLCGDDNDVVVESGRLDANSIQEIMRGGRRIVELCEDDSDVVRSGRLDANTIQEIMLACRRIVKLCEDDSKVIRSGRLVTNSIQKSIRADPRIDELWEDDSDLDDLVIEKGHLDIDRIQENLPEGRRIVDIGFTWTEIHRTFEKHNKGDYCDFRDWKLVHSLRRGLKTQLFFKCQMCDAEDNIWTEPTDPQVLDINTAMVAGTISVGNGYAQLEELCAAANVPCMSEKTYINRREDVIDDFEKSAMQSMKMAGEEEKRLAIERNDVINGIPYITVVADGSWMKRSYGSAYDSPSGVGAIIGYHTKKVLFVGIRNKYCAVCNMAERRGLQVRKHKCYKNFDNNASSTRMESDAIVEGFKSSLEMHGLIYKKLIADGDSSVYNSIKHNAPYHEMNVMVEKIECTNHLLRNLCKKLKAVARTTMPKTMVNRKRDFVQLRNIVDSNIFAIRKEVLRLSAVRRQGTQAHHTKAKELLKDILNIPSHIFGEHKRCRELGVHQNLCNNTKNYVPSLKQCGLFQQIDRAIASLSAYSDSLLINVTNNPAEAFNSIICKEIAGKRIHFGKRGSYNARIAGSVVQYNTQQVLTELHENMCKNVPAVVAKLEKRRQVKVARNKEYKQVDGRRKSKREVGPDSYYGPKSQKPDLLPHVFEQLQQHHAEKLLENAADRDKIECLTRGQSNCDLWQSLRRLMLTASNFGMVCRMRKTTSCAASVKSILYPPSVDTVAMKYGRDMEEIAREEIAKHLKKVVKPCGLFIDYEYPYLGASPDGLIDEDGLVEIKCPLSAKNLTADEALQKLPQLKNVLDRQNPDKMNQNHRFFYQVQGQLNVTRRDYCIFTVWTPKSVKMVRVSRDEVFWRNQMLPHLTRFYNNCLLPEILDSRYNRHMPIRDPDYILEALQTKEPCAKKSRSRTTCEEDASAEQVNQASSLAVSPLEEQDDDCIFISYSTEEFTEEDARIIKKNLDEAVVPLFLLEQNILPVDSRINDSSLDAFLRIVRETSPFETQSVQYLESPKLIDANNSDDMSIQIIGGNCTDHWRCIFFDGFKLHMYDSIPGCTYNKLAEKEKDYIRIRFPQINGSDIIFEKVQTQPDCYSCGIYAAAFATAIALGKDPCEEKYSNDVNRMRRHFLSILQSKELTFFPT